MEKKDTLNLQQQIKQLSAEYSEFIKKITGFSEEKNIPDTSLDYDTIKDNYNTIWNNIYTIFNQLKS